MRTRTHNTTSMARVSGFERALQQAVRVAGVGTNAQVVVLIHRKPNTMTVWALNKSLQKPFATWQTKGNSGYRTSQRFRFHVLHVPGEQEGHLIAMEDVYSRFVVRFLSLRGACLGGYQVPGDPVNSLDVIGNCVVSRDRWSLTVFAVQSRARAVALFAMKGPTPISMALPQWQEGHRFYVQWQETFFEVNLLTGGVSEGFPQMQKCCRLLQVERGASSGISAIVYYDPRLLSIVRQCASGRRHILHDGRKEKSVCEPWYFRPTPLWNPTIGCIAWTSAHNRFRVVWPFDEDGWACQALRMSCSRKTWIQVCGL